MNINDFSQLYRRKVREPSQSETAHRLKLDRVGARTLRVLTHVTVESLTDDYTKCRLGIDHGGVDLYLDELTTIAAAELIVSRSDIILGEGDVFFAEVVGVRRNEFLVMCCVGWELKL